MEYASSKFDNSTEKVVLVECVDHEEKYVEVRQYDGAFDRVIEVILIFLWEKS